jgi:N-acetylglutamate synthase-like GNAT family acetyltransferase
VVPLVPADSFRWLFSDGFRATKLLPNSVALPPKSLPFASVPLHWRPMNASDCTVRRATVDDLGGLKELWERARLQVLDLEKRLTEFQLIISDTDDLVGAIGLRIEGKQGKLHSEAFTQPEQEAQFRPLLWERIQAVSRNHGLVRLWTQELSPFWHQAGFADASPDALKKIPGTFGDAHGRWLTLQLKEEIVPTLSLDQEFELFQQSQRQSTEQVMAQARKLKTAAYVIGTIVLVVSILGALYVVQRVNQEKNRRPAPQTAPNSQPGQK